MRRTVLMMGAIVVMWPQLCSAKEIWACQQTHSAGFNWQGGVWRQTTFTNEQFLLTIGGTTSSYKLASGREYQIECTPQLNRLQCMDRTGGAIVFSPTLGTGAISQAFGAIMGSQGDRDSVSISIFNCAKF